MEFKGAWYSKDYSGEGIFLDQAGDTVAAGFYSYEQGKQKWIVAFGPRSGAVATLDAITTSGGAMGDKDELKKVTESPWGKIKLTDKGDRINVWFQPLSDSWWDYDMEKLLGTQTRLKLETKYAGTASPWREVDQLWGVMEIPAATISRKKSVGQDRITVIEGELTITEIHAQGPNNPAYEGVSVDQVFRSGDSFIMTAYIGPLTITSGIPVMSNYGLVTKELGQIVQYSINMIY